MSLARRSLWLLAALLVFGSGGFVCRRVADRGRFASAYSSYGSGPEGVRALYLLAQRLGARPARWSEDLAALPAGSGMLVALGDCEDGMARPVSRYERRELTQWVQQGGVLLVAGARHYLPEGMGVDFAAEAGCEADTRFRRARRQQQEQGLPPEALGPPGGERQDAGVDGGQACGPAQDDAGVAAAGARAEGSGGSGGSERARAKPAVAWTLPTDAPLRGLQPLPMREPGRLELEPDADARVILELPGHGGDGGEQPRPAGVVVRHGRGHVIALASASLLQNRALGLADGGLLFARLLRAYAPAGPVLFDEYHLGVGERRSLMRYLREAGATPFIAQLLLVALLLLLRAGASFGGVREPSEPAPAGIASLVSAMGSLFARANDPAGAIRILGKQALARVAAHHHLPPSSARALARSLDERGAKQAAEAVRTIARAERILANERDLAAASRRIDEAVARALDPTATVPAPR